MNSKELHRHLRDGLGGWFREQRFRVSKHTPLGWVRPPLLVWIQCDSHGWDRHAGSSFFVNFQIGNSDRTWEGPTRRLQEFLTDGELEAMRGTQNAIVPKFTLPPREHVAAVRAVLARHNEADADRAIDAYLSRFKSDEEPYRRNQDVALRYWDADDVARWTAFLLPLLPRLVSELAAGADGRTI